jgi:hypothetical protein
MIGYSTTIAGLGDVTDSCLDPVGEHGPPMVLSI